MLFAAFSCLLRKGIDNILDEFDKFFLYGVLLALENSRFDIMDTCNVLQTLIRKQEALRSPWVREVISCVLGISISQEPIDESSSSSRFDRFYSHLEKECKNGQKPDFLKTLSTFSSMKELDADSALEVARECLKHDTGESQRKQRKRKRSSSSTIIQSKKKSPDVCALSLLTAQPQSQQTASSQGLEPTVPVINCSIQSIGASLTNDSPMTGTSDPLLSSSGPPIDRSVLSLSDQPRNTLNDDSIWETDSLLPASQTRLL